MTSQSSHSLTDLIGNTPLIRLQRFSDPEEATLFAKVEYFNPGGSIKDRIAWGMIQAAETQGHLKPGSTLVEPTGGNTGIGLAMICAARGYRLIAVMPEGMSQERADLSAAFQEAVAEVLVGKAVAAARRLGAQAVLLAGGVAANLRLRTLLRERSPVNVYVPPVILCTDNAAMIAAAGFFQLLRMPKAAGLGLDVDPGLRFA